MNELPPTFVTTRESLHALACYVLGPARKARTGRIGLRPTGEGFGTPPFEDGSRIAVRGDRLLVDPGNAVPITTLRDAAGIVGVELSADPGVGRDLPPFQPDVALEVDERASLALGEWYAFGAEVLAGLRDRHGERHTVSEAQLWPEHFDLALSLDDGDGRRANIGASPGDAFSTLPYFYVGPWDMAGLVDPFWNAPFGAVLAHEALVAESDPVGRAGGFVDEALRRLGIAT
jgi:hypothetical protein